MFFYYYYYFDKYKLFIIVPFVLITCFFYFHIEAFAMQSDPDNIADPLRFYNSGGDDYYENRPEEGGSKEEEGTSSSDIKKKF